MDGNSQKMNEKEDLSITHSDILISHFNLIKQIYPQSSKSADSDISQGILFINLIRSLGSRLV